MIDATEEREKNPIDFYEYLGPSPATDTHDRAFTGAALKCADSFALRRYVESEIRVFEEKTTVNGKEYDVREAYSVRGPFGGQLADDGTHCFGTPYFFKGYIGEPRPWWDGYVEAHGYSYEHTEDCCQKPPKQFLGEKSEIFYNINPKKEGPFGGQLPPANKR